MTPQDLQVLQDFLLQLTQAQSIARRPEADAPINAAVSRHPGTAFLLVRQVIWF